MSTPRAQPPEIHGVMDALRAFGATLHEMAQVRGTLLAVELREEIERRKSMVILVVVGIALAHMALLLLSLLVTVAFWDTHRIGAIAAMASLYLGGGALCFARLRRALIASPAPFAASRRELAEDLAQLGAR